MVCRGRLASLRRRRRAGALLGLTAVAATLAGLLGCEKGDRTALKMPERPPAVVTVAPATTQDVPVYLDQIGRTVPVQTVAIVPQVGGKLVATHVNHGDYVRKGQLLFEIDPRPFQAALDAAEASLAQNLAELELARAELSRVEEALRSSAVSRLEYDQKKSGVAMAEARVAAAKAAIEQAKLDLEFSRIHSPIDGKAGARLVDAGNVVRANDAPLLIIQQMSPIFAEFTITENDLGAVRNFLRAGGLDLPNANEAQLKALVDIPADSARVLGALGVATATQPADATDDAAMTVTRPAGQWTGPREGTLSFLNNQIERETGTVKMRVTLPNEDRYFWPGQFVNVRLILTRKEQAVLVPATAQQIGQQGPFVYVVNDQNVAELRPIKLGQRQGDMVVVDEGVRPGEQVIVSGHRMVIPGKPVMVADADPASKSPAQMARK
ncbi:MAG TPA: efflux RND transporter periplasmic adaptor subunit [Phycisphaerae bacterium]|nr:efflux RND transporter periplasmic adaptor subunit [Phycisphaerae bacterium]HOM51292.1 efflux RND transporter periplasmic adaptor subunit [Phycisphaerae bacterium]